jgi:hypothetical protein
MRGEKVERVGGRIVHRGCTGNAERQWPVLVVSIRCMGVEKISGVIMSKKFGVGEGERGQSLGERGKRKDLCRE